MVLGRRTRTGRDPTETAPAGRSHILLVNDDPGGAELVRRLLVGAGHEVEVASNYDEAIAAMAAHPPRLIMADLIGGGVGQNLRLLDAVRSHPNAALAGTRIVFVSYSESNNVLSWQAGTDSFLERPFHVSDLLGCVAEVLQRPEEHRSEFRLRVLNALTGS